MGAQNKGATVLNRRHVGGQIDGGYTYLFQYEVTGQWNTLAEVVATGSGQTTQILPSGGGQALTGAESTEYWFVNTANNTVENLQYATSFKISPTQIEYYEVTLQPPFTASPPAPVIICPEDPVGGWSQSASTTTLQPYCFVGQCTIGAEGPSWTVVLELVVNGNSLVGAAWCLSYNPPSASSGIQPSGPFTPLRGLAPVWATSFWPAD